MILNIKIKKRWEEYVLEEYKCLMKLNTRNLQVKTNITRNDFGTPQ